MVLLYTSKQYSVLWPMFFMERQSYKSIAKFQETLFETNFSVKLLKLLCFLRNELLQHFEQIVITEFHYLLKFPY